MPIEDMKMDWNTLYCPNKCCRYYGIPFQALITASATPFCFCAMQKHLTI